MKEKLKGKRIFISGGAGVIGSELVKKLFDYETTIFVGDLKPRPETWPSSIYYRQGDLNYISKQELLDFEPEFFFHLAATFERTEETLDFWQENFHHNIKLTHHLMDILKDCPSLRRIIFASSYLVYDPSQYLFEKPQTSSVRLSEDYKIFPRNLTGMSKLYNEREIEFFSQFSNTKFTSISARIFRVFGKNSRDVISRWIRAILNEETIYVYAKEGRFDYIYAEDVAEGLIHLAISDISGAINLGSDCSYSISDVLSILDEKLGKIKIVQLDKTIPFEASQANMDKFINLIGWKPKISLEEGIQIVIDYEIKRSKS